MDEPAIEWLEIQAGAEIAGSRRTAADGTTLSAPDGLGHYDTLLRRSGGAPR